MIDNMEPLSGIGPETSSLPRNNTSIVPGYLADKTLIQGNENWSPLDPSGANQAQPSPASPITPGQKPDANRSVVFSDAERLEYMMRNHHYFRTRGRIDAALSDSLCKCGH